MKKKPTIAGLSRELKAATARADNNYSACTRYKEEIKTLKDQRDHVNKNISELKKDLHAVQLECAELHGFINRVEIEDDVAWYESHGATHKDIDDTITTKPPLRQRLKGVRIEPHSPNDIYSTNFGRPLRHGG